MGKCESVNCDKHASYGEQGKAPSRCAPHGKALGLVNVKTKTCLAEHCSKAPHFGIDGQRPTHCKTHGAPLGFVNVTSAKCKEPGCGVRPSYGKIGTKKALYCSQHGKPKGFVDIANARCIVDGCTTSPTFGPAGGRPSHYDTSFAPLVASCGRLRSSSGQPSLQAYQIFDPRHAAYVSYINPTTLSVGLNCTLHKVRELTCNR